MKKIWDDEKDGVIFEHYAEKGSEYCSGLTGMTPKQVSRRASKLNIKVTTERRSKTQSENSKSGWDKRACGLNVNYRWFINDPSPQSAYILGYLWADGNLNNKSQSHSIRLEILYDDFQMIEGMLDLSGKWHKQNRHRDGRKKQAICSCNNFVFYNFLKAHNYEEKSLESPESIIRWLPDSLVHYWFRGFSDGDGCFYVNERLSLYQFSLAGSHDQKWDFVSEWLDNNGIEHYIEKRVQGIVRTTKSSVIRMNGKHKVTKFGDYIYQGEQFGLDRKYEKYRQIKEKIK
jgi:hypothetical protein